MPNAKAIGTPRATHSPTIPTKKITRLRLPISASSGRASHNPNADREHGRQRGRGAREAGALDQPRHHDHQHEHGADLDRRDPVAVADFQRRRGDEPLNLHIVARRRDHHDQEGGDHHGGEGLEPAPPARRRQPDQEGEPHVLGAAQRDDRAEHGEPQEQRRGELVRPGQRGIEDVARDRRRSAAPGFPRPPAPPPESPSPRRAPAPGARTCMGAPGRCRRGERLLRGGNEPGAVAALDHGFSSRLPTCFSSAAHACGPYFCFQSA